MTPAPVPKYGRQVTLVLDSWIPGQQYQDAQPERVPQTSAINALCNVRGDRDNVIIVYLLMSAATELAELFISACRLSLTDEDLF